MMTAYDVTVMRTIVEIPDKLVKSLDEMGKKKACSRAALIREAIAEYLSNKTHSSPEKAFGIWKKKNVDAVEYQRNLRSEWEK
jgi:metal-responsive CopG/Arc/MetJ family transcriptional regulator